MVVCSGDGLFKWWFVRIMVVIIMVVIFCLVGGKNRVGEGCLWEELFEIY